MKVIREALPDLFFIYLLSPPRGRITKEEEKKAKKKKKKKWGRRNRETHKQAQAE
jgi:hypothetical protein